MRDILVHLHFSLQVIWQGEKSVRLALRIEVYAADSDPRQCQAVQCALSLPRMHFLAKRVQ